MRCPRWALEEECPSEMHAYALAQSAFPDEPGENPFFRRQPRQIAARIFGVEHPSTTQLAEWLVDDKQLEKRLHGTDVGKSLVKDSPEMRSGVIAHLSELGRSLRLWPSDAEQPRAFSVKRWAKERKGNIFLCSTPDTIDALRPTLSMLLDALITQTQSIPGAGAFILDEIPQLNRLPKLETAMSLQRGVGNPIILIFQEVSQLKRHYGDLWPALVSQAYTQIIFRTSEPESARHASGVLGQREVERIRESRPAGLSRSRTMGGNYQTERVTTPVVTPGQIQSLEDGKGYLSAAGRITKIDINYLPSVARAQKLVERIVVPKPVLLGDKSQSPVQPPRYRQRRLPLKNGGDLPPAGLG
jgi:hypothetical protein